MGKVSNEITMMYDLLKNARLENTKLKQEVSYMYGLLSNSNIKLKDAQ
jgi:hypothetical protein